MKLSEKIIIAILTISFGVLLIGLHGRMISVVTTILGISLIVVGVMDFLNKDNVQGGIKLAAGIIAIALGWLIVDIVLYLVAAILVVVGGVGLYHEIKWNVHCKWTVDVFLIYVKPSLCVIIGLLLFFNAFAWAFYVAGAITVLEGCVLLVDALRKE